MLYSVSINNKIYSVPNQKANKLNNNPSFKGLTKNMERQIYKTADMMQKLYNANKGSIAGSPPPDITKAIVSISGSKIEARQNISDFIKSINAAVSELKKYDELSLKAILDFDFHKYFDKKGVVNGADLAELFAKTAFFIPDDEIKIIEKNAAHPVEKALKQNGILPDDGKVLIKYLGSGEYGNAFNISFRDKDNEKIFHDKAIKVYRSEQNRQKIIELIFKRQFEYFHNISFFEYWDAVSREINNYYNECFSNDAANKILNEYIPVIIKQFNKMKSSTVEELVNEFNKEDTLTKGIHGCFAEANRALFIKDKIGNMRKTDYIEPYYFDFENGYAIMEMADKELPKVKKQIDLVDGFNLAHSDAWLNSDNKVCGRIIDYGGITCIDA